MLLAYYPLRENQQIRAELCLISDELDQSIPVFPVRLLKPTSSALYRVGPKEALSVTPGDSPGSLILRAIRPAILYLTPNSPIQPGYAVTQVQLVPEGETFKTYFIAREDATEWKPWEAHKN